MKITDTIHAIRHPFRLLLGEGRYVERFVYSYLIVGKTICLVDAGVAATAPLILLTHAHPDHIGRCAPIRKLALIGEHNTDSQQANPLLGNKNYTFQPELGKLPLSVFEAMSSN